MPSKIKKVQVLFIHGGMTFKNRKDYLHFLRTRDLAFSRDKRWSDEYLSKSLGAPFDVLRPSMPLRHNARYEDWKITFERYFKMLTKPTVLIGHSLGGVFLVKYLSEHRLSKKPLGVYLVAAPIDNTIKGEDLVGGFVPQSDLSRLDKSTPHLHLFFSEDDDCVPVSHAEKFARKLPNAKIHVYKKRGHFCNPTFPEIVKHIREDVW